MSGQRSSSSGGAAASVAAGCTLRESASRSSLMRARAAAAASSMSLSSTAAGAPSASYGGGLLSGGTSTASFGHRHHHSSGVDGGLAVFSWGRGEDGQLGIGDTSDQDEPTYVDALRGVGVRQIACGSGHTVVLTTDGEVYTWGRGDDGRLGHGDNGWKYVPRIAQSLAGQVIVQVTCGSVSLKKNNENLK
mmetsp:Transcript_34774/g.52483  ORF Transcript_34774/g.52483 Transcript_34774/m.52483 type:complete len:191 (+) Transcript_34774:195-767(+)